jgi:Glycosyl transferases group 1
LKKKIVIAFYSHPEYYPPTLNAIDQLAQIYEKVFVLHRNVGGFDWQYPENVELIGPKKLVPVRDVEKAGLWRKLSWFFLFTRVFFTLIRKHKPHTILLYDCIPIFSYRLISRFFPKPNILWYHNHDVSESKYTKKFSIGWFGWKSEYWIFPRLQIFSLPSIDRKPYFPLDRLYGVFVFIPNFPSKARYFKELNKDKAPIKLLFQGSIGIQHGLENIIPILGKAINGHNLMLVLKGFISDEYLRTLKEISEKNNVIDRLIYLPPSGYEDVIRNANSCHIGIGIFMKQDLMNQTLGTASNKIYEYAASGLPVLLYDNEQFRNWPGEREWVFFTDASTESIENCIAQILSNYDHLSGAAKIDVKENFLFESYFKNVLQYLN